jgi:predicted component of type VI protein secretion system
MGSKVHMFVQTRKKVLWLRNRFKEALSGYNPRDDFSVSNDKLTDDEKCSMMWQVCISFEQHALCGSCTT